MDGWPPAIWRTEPDVRFCNPLSMTSVSRLHSTIATLAMILVSPSMSLAQETILPTKGIIEELTIDLDRDGSVDRLFLIEADGFADLLVFRGMKDGAAGRERFMALPGAKEFAFGKPWFVARSRGVVAVGSAQSQGRYKWEQSLTLAWRSGKLRVIGITYAVNDSISSASRARSCDLNLSTGKGVANGKAVNVAMKPVPVEEWSDKKLPAYCSFS